MADLGKYVPWAVLLGSTSVPFRNLQVLSENLQEAVGSDGALYPELVAVLQKRPIFRCTLLDPSLVTDFQAVESGENYTQVKFVWRAVTQQGGPSGAYISLTVDKGALFPLAINSDFEAVATTDIECRARFTSGTAVTFGTDSATRADTNVAYRASQLVIGSDTVTKIQNANVQWNWGVIQEEMLEPDHYGYDTINQQGDAELSELSLIDVGRLEDGAEETVTLTLADLVTPASTVAISFGTSFVEANFSGRTASFVWRKLVD